MSKGSNRRAEIYGCFEGLADIHTDKSADFLIQMTADTMKCSHSDVVAALEAFATGSGDDVSAAGERNDG